MSLSNANKNMDKHSKLTAIMLTAVTTLSALSSSAAETGIITSTSSDGKTVVVNALNDYIIKVSNFMPGESVRESASAVMEKQPFNGTVSTTGHNTTMTLPSGLSVTVDRNSAGVTFFNGDDRMLYDDGTRSSSQGMKTLSLIPVEGGIYYGAGERGHSLKLNGDTLVMYNRQNYGYTEGDPRINQMNICVPLFVSNTGYGILFDDYAAAKLIMGDTIKYETESRKPVSYYFIYGKEGIADVTSQYTLLTGRQQLPPFWSLGYITSKYGYKTQEETCGVIDTLKREGYPVDGIVLDLYWYGKETDMGRLEWNREQWGDHKKMLAGLKDKGVNTVIISQPYINKIGAIDNYNMLAEKGMLTKNVAGDINDVTTWVGEAGMFDVANPDTRRWLRERYRSLTDEGVGGWWGDLGEPEVHPETIVHHNGETAREYHNQYGNVWSSIIYDLFKDEYPDTRLMTLMRGGTAGLQRYSVFPWSTDVSRSWGGLQPQVKIMLNSGLSGLGYMSHDVGGFAIDEQNPTDPELYVRWLQLGVFSPILRTHAQKYAEPYKYPEYSQLLRDLIKMRYRWLPYNYTLAYENATKGYPLVRPVNFDGITGTPADTITDEFMWGSEVLVAPVLQQGAVTRNVYIPEGKWIDWNNPEVDYQGPAEFSYNAPLETIPLLIRNGAFIPQADYAMENTGDYNPAAYTILYFPRGEVKSRYVLFEDDRSSTSSLDRGEYALMTFTGDAADGKITIGVDLSGYYPGMPAQRELTFVLPGICSKVSEVSVNGVTVPFEVTTKKDLKFSTKFFNGKPLKIEILAK